VVPFVALRKGGGADVFRAAVGHFKRFWGVLATLDVAIVVVVHLLRSPKILNAFGHGGRRVAVVLGTLCVAVLSTYATGFDTELATKSDTL
jgi:hypothetical protein